MNDAQRAICFLRGHDDEQRNNQQALVRILKSDVPLDRDLRYALGLLFDPTAFSAFEVKRRKNGNPIGPVQFVVQQFEIGREVEERLAKLKEQGGQPKLKKLARGQVAARRGLADSTVKKAHLAYVSAVESGFADQLRPLTG